MMMPWLLILVGLICLLENLGFLPWLNWSVVWPIILILVGLSMFKKKGGCCGWHSEKKPEENK